MLGRTSKVGLPGFAKTCCAAALGEHSGALMGQRAVQLDISYTSFVRTTSARHRAVVEMLLETVWQNGDVYKAAYEGRYCVGCEEFKDEQDLDGAGNCPVHKKPCPPRREVCRPPRAALAAMPLPSPGAGYPGMLA